MRIYIRTSDGKSFSIPAPMWLVSGVLGLGNFGTSIARKYVPEDQRQYVDCVDFHELRRGFHILRQYKGLTLVDIKSSDGTEVTIVV
jgi:hypothetical protein